MALLSRVARYFSNYLKLVVIIAEVVALAYALFLLASIASKRISAKQILNKLETDPSSDLWLVQSKKNQTFMYTRESRVVWIGGVPRSGTTLMRVILDAHRQIRCGPETRIIPNLLLSYEQLESRDDLVSRHREAGISDDVMDHATASLIMQILMRYDDPAPILCVKDPFSLNAASIVRRRLFPNSRFILMLRDGRATVHSIIARQVSISNFDMQNHLECLKNWNQTISKMLRNCVEVGFDVCMPVYYELLVLDTAKWVRKIAEFLDVEFDKLMLNYHTLVDADEGIHVSRTERSTDQVRRPIYVSALTDWVSGWPADSLGQAAKAAPMLDILGFDSSKIPPKYDDLSSKYEQLLLKWKSEFTSTSRSERRDHELDVLYGVVPS